MTETELRNEIKKNALSGAYFFYGDEDYMKHYNAEAMRRSIFPDEATASFNRFLFDDETAEFGAIHDALLSSSMMMGLSLIQTEQTSAAKMVELSLTSSELFRDKAGLTKVLECAASSADTVLLIRMAAGSFDAGTAKKPSALMKLISKYAKCVQFDYQTEAKLTKWLLRHAEEYHLTLSPATAAIILRRTGRSMYRLQGEIEKAAVYAASHGFSEITAEAVDAVVTKTDDEDAFRLANDILNGDKRSALLCLGEKIRRKEEPIFILSQVTRAFCEMAAASRFLAEGRDKAEFARSMKIHPYRADLYYKAVRGVPTAVFDRAVARCVETDRLVKSSNLGYIAIERLICG